MHICSNAHIILMQQIVVNIEIYINLNHVLFHIISLNMIS